MHKSLKISPAPFKPSRLSIPPSPFSPRSPFTPVVSHRYQTQGASRQSSTATLNTKVNAPSSPLKWTWTCHQCRNSYGLAVTRRCLEDGHFYCSGQTALKAWREPINARRTRKRGACSSEFDYSSWKEWSRWRRGCSRDEASLRTGSPVNNQGVSLEKRKKDCWNMCDYPSECKWGRKFGIHTPTQTRFTVPEPQSVPTLHDPVKTTSESIPKRENYRETRTSNSDEIMSFWTALLVSAEMRKNSRRPASSPLSDITEVHKEAEKKSSILPPSQDSKGDGTKAAEELHISSDPSVLEPSNSSNASTFGVSLKPLLSRRRYRRGNPSSTKYNSKKAKHTKEISTSHREQQVTLNTPGALGDWPELIRMPSRQACFV